MFHWLICSVVLRSIFLQVFFVSFLINPLGKIFDEHIVNGSFYLISTLIMMILFFFFFVIIGQDKSKQIMGQSNFKNFAFGVLTWLLAFPISSLIGVFAQVFVRMLNKYSYHEQVAVTHLKNMMNDPWLFFLTVLSFSIIVPFLEELIFRGLLQNFIKRYSNKHLSIVVTALIFALFHYSSKQGYDNIELIISLFVLGWFLGFIYEKKASLMAPFGLHFAFNTISIIRIIMSAN